MSSSPQYNKVEEADSDELGESHVIYARCQRSHIHYKSLLMGLATAILMFTSAFFFAWNSSPGLSATGLSANLAASLEDLNCGQSIDEALALGCEFDMVSVAWTPKQCIDVTSANEFEQWLSSEERTHPWPFWTDSTARTHLQNKDELSHQIGVSVWTSAEYHIGHCAFEFRRMQRSVSGDALLKKYMRNEKHTLHCLDTMLGVQNFNRVDTYFNVSFGTC